MLTQILLLLLLLLLFYVYCSTMVFRKSVVLSVLVAVASKSVFADVGLSPRGGENRRQLKRGKKSKPTASPTISGRPAFTRGTIELRFYVPVVEGVLQGITHLGAIDALDTSQSIVGSKTIMTAGGDQIFKADDVNKENALNEFSITTTFETTVGSFETGIEQSSCDVTLCLTVPRIGGCVFLRSGGQYLLNPFPPANETVSPPMAAASIGGTGYVQCKFELNVLYRTPSDYIYFIISNTHSSCCMCVLFYLVACYRFY
jgi:hypothetical protein